MIKCDKVTSDILNQVWKDMQKKPNYLKTHLTMKREWSRLSDRVEIVRVWGTEENPIYWYTDSYWKFITITTPTVSE